MDPRRARIIFTVVLLALFVPVVVVLALQGGDDAADRATGLRLEIDPDQDVVTAYIDDAGRNRPDAAGGNDTVRFECRDRAGKVLVRSTERWPFIDTDGETTVPHVHVNVPGIEKLAACAVLGTDPPLGGEVSSAGR